MAWTGPVVLHSVLVPQQYVAHQNVRGTTHRYKFGATTSMGTMDKVKFALLPYMPVLYPRKVDVRRYKQLAAAKNISPVVVVGVWCPNLETSRSINRSNLQKSRITIAPVSTINC